MDASDEFDVIVIGGGPAGEVAAGRLTDLGFETALVEEHLVGGECAYYACMPSKALLRPNELLTEARRVAGVREALGGGLDVAAILRRRDEVIHELDDSGQLPWLEDRGIALVRSHGRLDGERCVRAGDRTLRARKAVVVATGSAALLPSIPGLAEARPWTNREATTSSHVPERLLVLGAGVVGVELAQAYASLGSSVTLVEGAPRIIGREEPFASEQLAAALQEQGIEIHTDVKVTGAHRAGDGGEVTLTLEGEPSSLSADELLVAVGRRPLTDDLGLDTLGVQAGGYLNVDDRMRVEGHPWLFAIGDVNGRSLLTHMGKYQARVACRVIDGDESAQAVQDDLRAPRVIFTDPHVAAVGLTEAAARDAGIDVLVISRTTAGTAGASFVGRDTAGSTQLVIDRARDVVIGATFVGIEVADFLHAATIAVVGEIPLRRLFECVPAFPTRSEIWLKLLEAWESAS